MSTMRWVALGALGAAWLAGCYGSDGQAKDSQSHWLQACSSDGDCGDSEQCACGVCTIECEESAACGASSRCASTSSHAACEGSGPARVCLSACDDDDDCGASGLECQGSVCVAVVATDGGTPDSDVPDVDNPVDSGEPPSMLGQVETIDGWLTCDEAHERVSSAIDARAALYKECETERDCVCASTSTECYGSCEVPIALASFGDFMSEVARYDSDYCSDPNLHEVCGYVAPACQLCVAACVAGRCESVGRTPCDPETGCEDGQVCHIDETCLGRGEGDVNGVTTLAIASDREGLWPFYPGITAFAVTADSILWIDAGTFDATEAHNSDGVLYRMALDDDQPVMLASNLAFARPHMEVDATHVYYTTVDGVWSMPLDGVGDPVQLVRYIAEDGSWALHGGYLYYEAISLDGFNGYIQRVDLDGQNDTLYRQLPLDVRQLASGGDRLYAELWDRDEDHTHLVAYDAEGDEELLTDNFRLAIDYGPLLVSGGAVLGDRQEEDGIQVFDVMGANVETMAGQEWVDQRSVHEHQVYFFETVGIRTDTWRYKISRSSIATGEHVLLRHATSPVGHIVATRDHLYWVEDKRLMRKAL